MEFLVLTLSLIIGFGAFGPVTTLQSRRPVVFATSPQTLAFVLDNQPHTRSDLQAIATFSISSANLNDTLAGSLTFTLSDKTRANIALASDKPVGAIPSTLVAKEITARFRKGATCPALRIEMEPVNLAIEGIQLRFSQFTLVIKESKDDISQLLCFWTKQINASGHRRGIISRINRLLAGEDDTQ